MSDAAHAAERCEREGHDWIWRVVLTRPAVRYEFCNLCDQRRGPPVTGGITWGWKLDRSSIQEWE